MQVRADIVQEVNHIILTGEVVADAAFGHTVRGTEVTTFTLAFFNQTSGGERRKGYIDVVCLGETAAVGAAIARRARPVRVEGSIQQRSWKTEDGFQRSKTEIVAHAVFPLHEVSTDECGRNHVGTGSGRKRF